MTRTEALLKLLAVEPETKDRLIVVTGWPAEETAALLEGLLHDKRVGYVNGACGAEGKRLYYAKATAASTLVALPVATGSRRERVRNRRGGLVREKRAVASVWSWAADAAGN